MNPIGLAIVIVLAVLGARWLYGRLPRRRERKLMRELLHMCHGDDELAERLMLGEITRNPGISVGEAARRARKRLMSDRRR